MLVTSTDIAAWLGAGAWLVPITVLVYKYCIKATIKIIPDTACEIGYTVNGPIFNIRLAIESKYKSSYMDDITLLLCHENGAKHSFKWVGIKRIFSEIRGLDGQHQVIERNDRPVCLHLAANVMLEDNLFRFNEQKFSQEGEVLVKEMQVKKEVLEKNNPDYRSELMRSSEFHNLTTFIEQRLFWQVGRYTGSFEISTHKPYKSEHTSFKFSLSQDQIHTLSKNIPITKEYIESITSTQSAKIFVWKWIYPSLEKF